MLALVSRYASDFDVAVASASLLQAAIDAGVGTRSGGTRTGPLDKDALNALGLSDVANEMSQQAGRPVKFMIFSNPNDAVAKAPSISLTGK